MTPPWSLVALAALTLQNPTPEDQARRLLEDARIHLEQGRVKQGLESLQTIVTGFANTSSADDALLRIGQHLEDVEGDLARAAEAYDQVTKRFPQGDSAAGAYYRIGSMTATRASGTAELDDALAQFQRVVKLYPGSPWVAPSLVASANVLRRLGRLDAAIDSARRASLEFPGSPAAPEALYESGMGLATAGEPLLALEDFQRIRSRYPDSKAAARALDAITALYRLSRPRVSYARDPEFSAPAGDMMKDVRALLMTPQRTLWIASNKTKSAVSLDPSLKLGPSWAAPDPEGLSWSPKGELVLASRLAVRTARGVSAYSMPGDKPGELEPLDRVLAAVVLPSGDVLIADGKKKRVFRFRGVAFQGPFPDRQEREVVRLATTPGGEVAMLRKDTKSIEFADESGRVTRSIAARGAGWEFKKPADLAVDAFANVYVADEETGVFVFSPKGALLASVPPGDIRKPTALTLDPSGALLVYDERAESVVRLR